MSSFFNKIQCLFSKKETIKQLQEVIEKDIDTRVEGLSGVQLENLISRYKEKILKITGKEAPAYISEIFLTKAKNLAYPLKNEDTIPEGISDLIHTLGKIEKLQKVATKNKIPLDDFREYFNETICNVLKIYDRLDSNHLQNKKTRDLFIKKWKKKNPHLSIWKNVA